ncbi:transposase [Trichonephila clavipes]|nr:transposase [Trichonephila clavipes]
MARIGQQKRYCVPSGQRYAIYVCSDSPEPLKAWLEGLMHLPFSPDLTPIDYHIFLALQNFLSNKKFGSREVCENQLLDVFANKGQDFYERGIIKPPIKWKQIIQRNGAYLTQIGQLEAC